MAPTSAFRRKQLCGFSFHGMFVKGPVLETLVRALNYILGNKHLGVSKARVMVRNTSGRRRIRRAGSSRPPKCVVLTTGRRGTGAASLARTLASPLACACSRLEEEFGCCCWFRRWASARGPGKHRKNSGNAWGCKWRLLNLRVNSAARKHLRVCVDSGQLL